MSKEGIFDFNQPKMGRKPKKVGNHCPNMISKLNNDKEKSKRKSISLEEKIKVCGIHHIFVYCTRQPHHLYLF
jgi:hypothetical protein